MMKTSIYCDVCGTQKKETNHWFVISGHNFYFSVTKYEYAETEPFPANKQIYTYVD